MFRVLNDATSQSDWPQERHLEFVQTCEVYIKGLQTRNQLVGAQPLARQGVIVSRSGAEWKEQPLQSTGEIQVGYYVIRAPNLAEAVQIAKGNPEFEYGTTARVEFVRSKTKKTFQATRTRSSTRRESAFGDVYHAIADPRRRELLDSLLKTSCPLARSSSAATYHSRRSRSISPC